MRTRRRLADRRIVGAIRLHSHGTPPGRYLPTDLARGAAGAASVFLSSNCFVRGCVTQATAPKPTVYQRARVAPRARGNLRVGYRSILAVQEKRCADVSPLRRKT